MSKPASDTGIASAPEGADYFSVFGLPRKLNLDERGLTHLFHQRSREVHPDRFARASAEKQHWSLEQTSLLNDAYRTLKDPIARTEYLLQLEGVVLAGSTADKQEKKQTPPELLAEVFELNMQLEEMRMNAQAGQDDPQLRMNLEEALALFEEQLAKVDFDIRDNWWLWDDVAGIEDEREQKLGKERLAALLDKRRYIRNLIRDGRNALGSGPSERVR